MNKTIQNLLDLLKNTFNQDKIEVVIENPRNLYKIAYENGLSGTIAEETKGLIKDEEIVELMEKQLLIYVKDDFKKHFVIKSIRDDFNKNNIDFILLKGANLKKVYPETYQRSMGDVDVLVRETDIDKVKEVFKKHISSLFISRGPIHDIYDILGCEVEVHRFLRIDDQFKEFKLLDKVWEKSKKDYNNEYTMPKELELIYLMYHIKKHLYTSGIGLRSVIDIGMFLEKHQDEINLKKLNRYLLQTKSKQLFNHLVMYYDKYLDRSVSKHFLKNQVFDLELYEEFTEFIIKSGIHGLGFEFNRFTSTFASGKNQNISKGRSILKILFPSYTFMKTKYPKLLKYRVFLPIGWFIRIINVLVKKPKKTFRKLKQINQSKSKNIEKVSDLYKKMGI